jgi:ABC-type uncharacterized transport system auxiliary subunit
MQEWRVPTATLVAILIVCLIFLSGCDRVQTERPNQLFSLGPINPACVFACTSRIHSGLVGPGQVAPVNVQGRSQP